MKTINATYRYSSSYLEVYSLVFLHEYYENRLCQEIKIEPTATTISYLKDNQLIFKPINGGFTIVANENVDYTPKVFHEHSTLDFEFKFTNKYFLLFSDLNIDPETKYYIEEINSEVVYLNQGYETTAPELDRPSLDGVIRLFHEEQNPILPIRGIGDEEFKARFQMVYIKPRPVRLVYYCYGSTDKILQFQDSLNIISTGEFLDQIHFDAPEMVTTSSGMSAWRFISHESIFLKASFNGQLKIESNTPFGVYNKTLPNPSPSTIKYDPKVNLYISENYVKL